MNPTQTTISFFSSQEFNSFVARYGKGKRDFGLDWLCLSNADLMNSRIIGESIRIVTELGAPLELFHRMEAQGLDFKFTCKNLNKQLYEGFVKDKKYFVTKAFDENDKDAQKLLVDSIGQKKLVWKESRKEVTLKKAGLHKAVKKATGEYGIISEFSASKVTVCVPQITCEAPLPSDIFIAEYNGLVKLLDDGWLIAFYTDSFIVELNPHTDDEIPAIFLGCAEQS